MTFAQIFFNDPGKYGVVSFDVFDTLFHRVCHPEVIIERTCYEIANSMGFDPRSVIGARYDAVKELRREAALKRENGDPEYMFSELPERMTLKLESATGSKIDEIKIREALAREIALEKRAIFPNVEMIEFARQVKAYGKRVIAISDMYLSAEEIHSLLDEVGAGELFSIGDIFVSGTYGVTKASGKLFQKVLESIGVPSGGVLHIGDNEHSDKKMAKASGLGVTNFHSDAHHRRYALHKTMKDVLDSNGEASHEAGLSALRQDNVHDRIASVLAPVLCHFTWSLVEKCSLDRPSDVWFLSRDGYLLKKLYDLANARGNAPPSKYLYVSRKAVGPASSREYGIREAFLAEWNGEGREFRKLLAPFVMSEPELQEIASKYRFSSPSEILDTAADPRLINLLKSTEMRERLNAISEKARKKLMKYLETSGFLKSERPALVDVGWAGQIQEGLAISLELEGFGKKAHGYYLALRRLGALRRLSGLSMEGVMFDASTPDWKTESVLHAVDVFEDACRATHGTVIGYSDAGEPILADGNNRSFVAEQKGNERIRALQSSILKYAARWFRMAEVCQLKASDTRVFAAAAATMLARFPSAEQAEYFSDIDHSLDSGNDIILSKNEFSFSFRPRVVVRFLRASRWKAAALSKLPAGRVLQLLRAFQTTRHRQIAVENSTEVKEEWESQSEGGDSGISHNVEFFGNVEKCESTPGKLYRSTLVSRFVIALVEWVRCRLI